MKITFLAAALMCCTAFAQGPWPLPAPGHRPHPAAGTAADPQTYSDGAGFKQRQQELITALATNDLSKWRRGYFAGGDPGKYIPGPAMAKLLLVLMRPAGSWGFRQGVFFGSGAEPPGDGQTDLRGRR